MTDDPSGGWEAVAAQFAALRSNVGTDIVIRWAGHLPPGGTVLDIGCGTGIPIARALEGADFSVYGIDPGPSLIRLFRASVPNAEAACETAEASRFFDRRFDGAIAIGLVFLLPEERQAGLIERVGRTLHPGGHFLFTAPRQPCRWADTLTGRQSLSLGEARYRTLLADAGMKLVATYVDDGANHYLHAIADRA